MNDISEIKEEVIETAKSVINEPISDTSRMGDFPKWDSLGHINLFMAIEKAFGMEFSPNDIERATSINDIVTLIIEKKHLGQLQMEPIQLPTGHRMYKWAKDLFPICRSLSGDGVRETLQYIKKILPNLHIHEVPSGTQAFDWTVPDEWNIRDAFVADENDSRIIDFKASNLHIVGYSEPVDAMMTFEELDAHLYSLPDQPDAINYVTSYYKRQWGFSISENQRNSLRKKPTAQYHVKIDSTLEPGHLSYGELIIPGMSDKEILLSSYICHPSMANNELSGPCVTTALAEWLRSEKRKYTYRLVYIPETIGAVIYLSRHLDELKKRIIAGFVLSCLGDDRDYSVICTPDENTLADRVANLVLKHHYPGYSRYSFLDRGSDERQYCAPGVELPVVGICRTKYLNYPEYHTSMDNLALITPSGLDGGYTVVKKMIETLEMNEFYTNTVFCEPQLGKRGLYPTISVKNSYNAVESMMDFLAYANGKRDLIEIAEKTGKDAAMYFGIIEKLKKAGLIHILDEGKL